VFFVRCHRRHCSTHSFAEIVSGVCQIRLRRKADQERRGGVAHTSMAAAAAAEQAAVVFPPAPLSKIGLLLLPLRSPRGGILIDL
jgi:hypothetical protein